MDRWDKAAKILENRGCEIDLDPFDCDSCMGMVFAPEGCRFTWSDSHCWAVYNADELMEFANKKDLFEVCDCDECKHERS